MYVPSLYNQQKINTIKLRWIVKSWDEHTQPITNTHTHTQCNCTVGTNSNNTVYLVTAGCIEQIIWLELDTMNYNNNKTFQRQPDNYITVWQNNIDH